MELMVKSTHTSWGLRGLKHWDGSDMDEHELVSSNNSNTFGDYFSLIGVN